VNREQNSAGGNIEQVLENGEITLQGQFLLGSNYTFLVKVKHEDQLVDAVYKPMRGEQPLWDFPPASLAGREVAAYIVSEALGLGFVPPTVLREGPFGPGSVQLHINYNPNYHYFNFKPADTSRLRPVAFFDLLVNNADRKGSHVFFQKRTRRLYSIDHGLCFHADDKLRTVIWDFAGQTIPEPLMEGLRATFGSAQFQTLTLSHALTAYLTSDELTALKTRADALITNPVFPVPPGDRRAFPYPPL
jgi:uncharacterized repeat protein (TIGR03843 family)